MTLFEHCYRQTWKSNFPLVSYNSRISKSFVSLLVVLLGLFAWYSFWTSILNINWSLLVSNERSLPKRKTKWLVRIQGTDEEKKRYVSPSPFHHIFLKLFHPYLTRIPQIHIFNFICINNLYYHDTLKNSTELYTKLVLRHYKEDLNKRSWWAYFIFQY